MIRLNRRSQDINRIYTRQSWLAFSHCKFKWGTNGVMFGVSVNVRQIPAVFDDTSDTLYNHAVAYLRPYERRLKREVFDYL